MKNKLEKRDTYQNKLDISLILFAIFEKFFFPPQ